MTIYRTNIKNNSIDILLGERHVNDFGGGTWCLPGGKLEWGERLAEAAVRETREECGLEVTNVIFRTITDKVIDGLHFVCAVFEAIEYSGNVQVMEPDKIVRWKWFPIRELPENLFEPTRIVIENIKHGIPYQ